MKKRSANYHLVADYVDVILYLNDLNLIITLMNNAGFRIQITQDDYEYESLEELVSAKGKNLTHLKLLGSNDENEFILIDYVKGKFKLATFWKSIAVGDLWNSILKVFRSNTDPWYWRLSPGLLSPISLITLIGINFIDNKASTPYYIGLGFAGLFSLLTWFSVWYQNVHQKLVLSNRFESGVFPKYGKEIFLLVIGGLITLLVTLIADLAP